MAEDAKCRLAAEKHWEACGANVEDSLKAIQRERAYERDKPWMEHFRTDAVSAVRDAAKKNPEKADEILTTIKKYAESGGEVNGKPLKKIGDTYRLSRPQIESLLKPAKSEKNEEIKSEREISRPDEKLKELNHRIEVIDRDIISYEDQIKELQKERREVNKKITEHNNKIKTEREKSDKDAPKVSKKKKTAPSFLG